MLRLLVFTLDKHDPLREWALEESAVLRELDNLRKQVQSQSQELARLRLTAEAPEYRKQASRVLETFARLMSAEREHGVPSPDVTVAPLVQPPIADGQPLVLHGYERVLLQLELPKGSSGRKYSLRLLEAKAGELWRGEVAVSASGTIDFATPPGLLSAGTYVIQVFDLGSPPKGKFGEYHFKVEHASGDVQPSA